MEKLEASESAAKESKVSGVVWGGGRIGGSGSPRRCSVLSRSDSHAYVSALNWNGKVYWCLKAVIARKDPRTRTKNCESKPIVVSCSYPSFTSPQFRVFSFFLANAQKRTEVTVCRTMHIKIYQNTATAVKNTGSFVLSQKMSSHWCHQQSAPKSTSLLPGWLSCFYECVEDWAWRVYWVVCSFSPP